MTSTSPTSSFVRCSTRSAIDSISNRRRIWPRNCRCWCEVCTTKAGIPRASPNASRTDEFVSRVEQDALLKGTSEAEDAARAVFAVLWNQLGDGTMGKIASILPGDYTQLM